MADTGSRHLNSVIANIDDLEKAGVYAATSLLQQKAAEIRANRVNWQSYVKGEMISADDYNVVTHLDTANYPKPETRVAFFTQNTHLCVKVIFRLLRKIAQEQTLQYILTMFDDLLQDDRALVDLLKDQSRALNEQPWNPFFAMLTREDGFIVNQASRIIAKIACWSSERMEPKALDYYLQHLKDHLRKPGYDYLISVARCLQMMLRIDHYRHAFVAADGISTIMNVLAGKLGFQLQYQLTFCLWCLTFNADITEQMNRYSVVPILADILSESLKEKVIRIILATLRNFLEKPSELETKQQNALSMVQCKVLKTLQLLEGRKFDDEDIAADVEFLKETLLNSVQDFSSFDEYATEVRSGRLEWSPVHKEERFWRENADRLNERNYELLKMLIHLLETNKDPLILCVAAHDIGEYVRHYPRGKRVIEQLGGKHIVMLLLNAEDPNVRYQALLAVQKLMVHNWEYLGKQLESSTKENNKTSPSSSDALLVKS